MDLVFGYPQDEIAWIGFFMVEQQMQGKGVGTKIIEEVITFLKTREVKKVQLAYVQGNEQSRNFWHKQQFLETGKVTSRLVEPGKSVVPCQVVVMERIL
ncbi:MAG: GNAT family N-acetyltransferase [Robinsoniella sp.]|nr:GNAT family N-acetyltransferase [Robinsoniella sp.]